MIIRLKSSLFIPYIIAEVLFTVIYISNYGFLSLVGEVFLSAIIGFLFIFNIGFFNLTSKINMIKPSDIFSSIGIGIGGFLLFLPGLISDTFGIIVITISLIYKLVKKPDYKQNEHDFRYDRYDNEEEIIDVEVIDDTHHIR
ncbi:putative membrane protein [Campylobacter pinnipediorum subsp. caledonicus]|uniref:FxsA family protein n=1 Tax=Campylobacter pinnipediorum TaxID=1965231 RepID=UPI0009951EB8|nr:FxsA family protein [Campylobacter pinnipediorum]AQW85699.1 putative membrane protein [Campylobacter pinnipediorum subsp. caledonicus]